MFAIMNPYIHIKVLYRKLDSNQLDLSVLSKFKQIKNTYDAVEAQQSQINPNGKIQYPSKDHILVRCHFLRMFSTIDHFAKLSPSWQLLNW